jgi:hypothetical protein
VYQIVFEVTYKMALFDVAVEEVQWLLPTMHR